MSNRRGRRVAYVGLVRCFGDSPVAFETGWRSQFGSLSAVPFAFSANGITYNDAETKKLFETKNFLERSTNIKVRGCSKSIAAASVELDLARASGPRLRARLDLRDLRDLRPSGRSGRLEEPPLDGVPLGA